MKPQATCSCTARFVSDLTEALRSAFLLSMLNIIAYFTESMLETNSFCPRTRTMHSVCATKFSVWNIGIFYREIFPYKMSVYV